MSGVSLSGDLKNPRVSIPRGTLAATGAGLLIYISVGVFLCFYASPEQLLSDNQVFLKISVSPEAVLAGLWAAAVSSGLGMILAAPRTIQALAGDGILPSFLSKTHGKNREPMVAMVLSLAIAEGAILLGKLDLVAPVLSMFFLATYGMLNLIAGLETLVENPSYRPTIKVPWWVSLVGAICSFYVMFLIDTVATLVAIAVMTGIYVHLKRMHLNATWGDLRRGFWLSLIRRALLQVDRLPEHPKNWRPNIMVVSGIPQGRLNLIQLADWLGSRRGLVTLHHVMVGPYAKMQKRRRMAMNNLIKFIQDERLNALPAVDVVDDRGQDLRVVATSQGFGTFQPNTVLLDWNERSELPTGEFEKLCAGAVMANKTLLVLCVNRDRQFGAHKKIDIWISPTSPRLPMLLILAYLISQDQDWVGSKITLHALLGGDPSETRRAELQRTLSDSRIPVVVRFHEDAIEAGLLEHTELVSRTSLESDLVILPFPYDGTESQQTKAALDQVAGALNLLPSVLMVRGQAYVDLKE